MHATKEPATTAPAPRTPARRGAAQPSRDGIARIGVPLQPRLSASELTRVLTAAPAEHDLATLDPVAVRALVADVLTQHGYDVLTRTTYDRNDDRHQDARRAIRRAYGHRFTYAPDEQAFLADPLLDVIRADLLDQP
ncbi:hypothetical protein C9F11_20995 [Streptomyces sp. YIM 121038]|uniref:DUF6181 family protein n=1 Tax=Streptomyces sp. YIM 121038 TaxID=2136401 RepID=UPI001110EF69|nr:DUF6181 family protein [Streptomyces sp. YIM 121038]QCX77831.1 hypothetical protein C9F11_20995 [Streptomyces sp. YIM 121038]